MGWLSLLKVGLQLVNLIAGIVREKQLLDAGEARGVAKSMAQAADRLGIGQALVSEIEAMTDEDLNAALRGDK
jgi:hypothetical protein